MMMHRLLAAGILTVVALTPALAQRMVSFGKPRVTITPAPWIPTPQPIQGIFPTAKPNALFGSDFFPAAPTVLLDNTTYLNFFFPAPNIVLDDANIPDTRDTDGDGIYYLTEIVYSFYVPSQQDVNLSVYLAGVDSVSGGPDLNDLAQPVATATANLTAGVYLFTVTFENCSPFEQTTLGFTSGGNNYDYFWTGISFGAQNCASTGPGMMLASGPDFEDDIFWWQGNQSCGGSAASGFYWFGGNPRASFYLKIMGAATLADAIVVDPDVDGNGCVDDADLLTVLFNFGSDGSNGGDANCDGIVDDADLLEVLFNFGSGC